jgi:hypothetical protein
LDFGAARRIGFAMITQPILLSLKSFCQPFVALLPFNGVPIHQTGGP